MDIDTVCVGEVLMTLLTSRSVLINETRDYHRYLEGLYKCCYERNRLGNTVLVATEDGFVHILKNVYQITE
jgi:hypothetical protein